MTSAGKVKGDLKRLINPDKAAFFPKFFKTGKGEYGEGDKFWGITVPQVRSIAKQYRDLSPSEIVKLLGDSIHEARACALFILVDQYKRNPKSVFDLYMTHLDRINNWDLVDASAPNIVGAYLFDLGSNKLLDDLAVSANLWRRRVAMVSTLYFIRKKDANPTLRIAKKLLGDREDLIHKASGWMLREMGKICGSVLLEQFLEEQVSKMPRTMLRYSIERLPRITQKRFMSLGK